MAYFLLSISDFLRDCVGLLTLSVDALLAKLYGGRCKPTVDFLLPSAYCLLPAAYCRVHIAYFVLPRLFWLLLLLVFFFSCCILGISVLSVADVFGLRVHALALVISVSLLGTFLASVFMILLLFFFVFFCCCRGRCSRSCFCSCSCCILVFVALFSVALFFAVHICQS